MSNAKFLYSLVNNRMSYHFKKCTDEHLSCALKFMRIITGTRLNSVDHIAFPNKGGAMENWGLITYGEQVLAVSAETSSAYGVQYIASFIAHEEAHLVKNISL